MQHDISLCVFVPFYSFVFLNGNIQGKHTFIYVHLMIFSNLFSQCATYPKKKLYIKKNSSFHASPLEYLYIFTGYIVASQIL